MKSFGGWACVCVANLVCAAAALAAADTPPMTPDIPKKFERPTTNADFIKREEMIPMRDGVKLHTVIVIPKGAQNAPIILTRTPYEASKRANRSESPSMQATLPLGDEVFSSDGYIRVFQDVRGKYDSEGDYVMTRPLRGPLNGSKVDHSTDAYDTIDWLVKHVKESNGKVGMIGSSYEGFTVLMALINPHPALKVAVPMSPMVDGWKGDDWFHNGAFRQNNLDYIVSQTEQKGSGDPIADGAWDDYETYRRLGSTADYARHFGIDTLPYWKKISEHPAYDAYWQNQALDTLLARQSLTVPTMIVASQWDQEDMYGAMHTYAALQAKDANSGKDFLVLGPWRHSGVNYDGSVLGPLKFNGDTALQFRRDVMKPFLDTYLKDGAARADTPAVFAYQTGTNRWQRLAHWPLACEQGCPSTSKPLYLAADSKLGFNAPAAAPSSYDEYVSDPAKPVPYLPRPVRFEDGDAWRRWLVTDQRFVADRPDVLVYETEPLAAPLTIAGAPVVNLFASTSGSDSDWVVKLIDVYPDEVSAQPEMGGYQLPIAMDIFRGRYRESFATPKAIISDAPLPYRFILPTVNHVFLPGHRVMIQVQSSWFPLYDRNPQTFVPNIFFAKPEDYKKATQRIYHESFVSLPVVEAKQP